MPILSVIIPVYNVSFYLEECLSSVVHQSLQDIEIICINDGSTDNSLEILKKWGKKDNRIVILNQENKGVSAARNEGLKIAKGNYITFVDADDMVCPNIYSSLIPKMQIYELDAYIFAFKTFPNEKIETIGFPTNRILTWQELFASNPQIQSKNSLCFNWRFIYKKEVLINNQLLFNKNIAIGEDMIYNIDAICHSHRIMVTNNALYIHRMNNPTSAMTLKYKVNLEKSLVQMYQVKKRQIEEYQLNKFTPFFFDLAKYTILVYIPMLLSDVYHNPQPVNKRKEIKHILSLEMVHEAFHIIGFRNIYPSWKEYIFYLAMKFKLTPIVYYEYNKIFIAK